MKKNGVFSFNKLLKELDKRRKKYLYPKFTKYVVDYKIEGDNIRVYSNLGKSRIIKNTRPNQVKLNQTIIKNKIDIANKIDEYEATSKERVMVILFNSLLLIASGGMIPLTFFIGNYFLFFIAIFIFSIASLATSIISLNYYVLISEIKNLKNITGYKKEMEFKLPHIDINQIKTR